MTAPSASVSENTNEIAISPSETAIITEPVSRMGFRPTRSTRKIAMSVTSTFVIEVTTLIVNESLSSNPTDCHRLVE